MSNAKKGEIDEAPAAESENMESEGLKEGVSSDDDSSPNSLAKIKSAEEDVENEGEGASSELDAEEER